MDIKILTDYEKQSIGERQPLPERYLRLSDDELDARIAAAKAALGERCVILGHHYQRDEVIKFADFIGDSLKLSRAAASRTKADYIVFCGVHFMAESADILRQPHQKVVLPDLAAGCSMADMAAPDQLEICWREMEQLGIRTDAAGEDGRAGVIPVTYINSSAAIKAFVGAHGGIVEGRPPRLRLPRRLARQGGAGRPRGAGGGPGRRPRTARRLDRGALWKRGRRAGRDRLEEPSPVVPVDARGPSRAFLGEEDEVPISILVVVAPLHRGIAHARKARSREVAADRSDVAALLQCDRSRTAQGGRCDAAPDDGPHRNEN